MRVIAAKDESVLFWQNRLVRRLLQLSPAMAVAWTKEKEVEVTFWINFEGKPNHLTNSCYKKLFLNLKTYSKLLSLVIKCLRNDKYNPSEYIYSLRADVT